MDNDLLNDIFIMINAYLLGLKIHCKLWVNTLKAELTVVL